MISDIKGCLIKLSIYQSINQSINPEVKMPHAVLCHLVRKSNVCLRLVIANCHGRFQNEEGHHKLQVWPIEKGH